MNAKSDSVSLPSERLSEALDALAARARRIHALPWRDVPEAIVPTPLGPVRVLGVGAENVTVCAGNGQYDGAAFAPLGPVRGIHYRVSFYLRREAGAWGFGEVGGTMYRAGGAVGENASEAARKALEAAVLGPVRDYLASAEGAALLRDAAAYEAWQALHYAASDVLAMLDGTEGSPRHLDPAKLGEALRRVAAAIEGASA